MTTRCTMETDGCPLQEFPLDYFTLYTLRSVCIFSIKYATQFLRYPTTRICLTIKSLLSRQSFHLLS